MAIPKDLHSVSSFSSCISTLHFFEGLLPVKRDIRYLGVKSTAPRLIGLPWNLKASLAGVTNTSNLQAQVFWHLRSPRLKITQGILTMIFQGWVIGTILFPLPILGDTPDEILEHPFRTSLDFVAGFPPKCPLSALYEPLPSSPSFTKDMLSVSKILDVFLACLLGLPSFLPIWQLLPHNRLSCSPRRLGLRSSPLVRV